MDINGVEIYRKILAEVIEKNLPIVQEEEPLDVLLECIKTQKMSFTAREKASIIETLKSYSSEEIQEVAAILFSAEVRRQIIMNTLFTGGPSGSDEIFSGAV